MADNCCNLFIFDFYRINYKLDRLIIKDIIKKMKNYKRPWGYSRVVGEWYLEVFRGKSDDLKGLFRILIDILERSIDALKKLHTLHEVSASISLLGDKILADGIIKEEYLELISIDCQSLEDLLT